MDTFVSSGKANLYTGFLWSLTLVNFGEVAATTNYEAVQVVDPSNSQFPDPVCVCHSLHCPHIITAGIDHSAAFACARLYPHDGIIFIQSFHMSPWNQVWDHFCLWGDVETTRCTWVQLTVLRNAVQVNKRHNLTTLTPTWCLHMSDKHKLNDEESVHDLLCLKAVTVAILKVTLQSFVWGSTGLSKNKANHS